MAAAGERPPYVTPAPSLCYLPYFPEFFEMSLLAAFLHDHSSCAHQLLELQEVKKYSGANGCVSVCLCVTAEVEAVRTASVTGQKRARDTAAAADGGTGASRFLCLAAAYCCVGHLVCGGCIACC
jgi:hypothetical protein